MRSASGSQDKTMRVIRLLFAIVCVLAATFAGGCALLIAMTDSSMSLAEAIFGFWPAIVAGLLAWWAMKHSARQGEKPLSSKQIAMFFLGVILLTFAAGMFLIAGFSSLYPDGEKFNLAEVFGLMLMPAGLGAFLVWISLGKRRATEGRK